MNLAGRKQIGQKDFLSLFDNYAQDFNFFLQKHNNIHLINRVNSFLPVISSVASRSGKFNLFVFSEEERALYFLNDIRNLIFDVPVLFLPAAETSSPVKAIRKKDTANLVIRNETISKISEGTPAIVVTYFEGIIQKVLAQKEIERQSFSIVSGKSTNYDELFDYLEEKGFKRTDFVYATGEFSIRGNIIDIYPFNYENPVRIVLMKI